MLSRLKSTPIRRQLHALSICLTSLFLLHSGTIHAQVQAAREIAGAGPEEDRRAIAAVLREYLRVTDEQNQDSIAASFHPSATLMSATRAGGLNMMTQSDWWSRISRPRPQPISRKSTIRYIDVAGIAAIARVDVANAASVSTDYFTLLRLREGWRISNKVLSSPLD